jgi:glycosyltransferase involved in cell wall biosynthesis
MRDRLILLAPIAPAPTGNGLAMRAELFRRAAADELDVQTVVVPVAGGASEVVLDAERARAGVRSLVSQSVWRDRFARAGRLPRLARAASPGLVDAVVETVVHERPLAVHVMRAYLAPLGLAVAERLEAEWATLDLDEDDAAFQLAYGDRAEAVAYDRLLRTFVPSFARVTAASPVEAEALGRRIGARVEHVPNAVDVPAVRPERTGDGATLLFVGNLTYRPNVEAAETLVSEIVPAIRRPLRVRLVGRYDSRLERLRSERVHLSGFVDDLAPVYAAADIVVAPLRVGSGTRIKLLEAFAHGVPVVASSSAAAGLAAWDGRHLLCADDAGRAAAAVEQLLADRDLADRLAAEAESLVRERYSTDVVLPAIRALFAQPVYAA